MQTKSSYEEAQLQYCNNIIRIWLQLIDNTVLYEIYIVTRIVQYCNILCNTLQSCTIRYNIGVILYNMSYNISYNIVIHIIQYCNYIVTHIVQYNSYIVTYNYNTVQYEII